LIINLYSTVKKGDIKSMVSFKEAIEKAYLLEKIVCCKNNGIYKYVVCKNKYKIPKKVFHSEIANKLFESI
jgi:hypothetical protein